MVYGSWLKAQASRLVAQGQGIIRLYNIGIKYYRKIISCFQKDIDPIFKISKRQLDGSSYVSGPRPFQNFEFEISRIAKSHIFKIVKVQGFKFSKFQTFKN